jgi:glycerophosphoryl diester phosphodiesterase
MPQRFWADKGVIAIAHRGGDAAGKEKENTLEAFQATQKLGYKYIETDIIQAASGELIVLHGTYNWLQASLSRGMSSKVLQMMTLDQIQTIVRPGGTMHVPTMEELLVTFPRMRFVVDVKTDEVLLPLVKVIKKLKAFERVCISDSSYQRCLKLIEASGSDQNKINAGLTVGRGLRFRNMNQILLKSGQLKAIDAIFMHHSLVSPPMINLIHRRGFKAIVWTANSSLGIKHAIRSGADGIISDRVELLKKLIEK